MMKAILEYMTSPCTQCFTENGRCKKTLGEKCPISNKTGDKDD